MKKHLIFIFLAIIGSAMGMNGFASEKKEPETQKSRESAGGHRINAFMSHEIIGSKVYNLQGERLGKIRDLFLDIDTGSIVYAVIDFGGFMGIGHKHFLVPWKSFATLPSEGIFYLDKSKEQLKNASGFDKTKTSDVGDMKWGAKIQRHYHDSYVYYDDYGYGYDAHGYGPYIVQWKNHHSTTIFDPNTIITIKGQLVKAEQIFDPEYGMILELLVYTGKKQIQRVYLGPCRYIAAGQERRFKTGDELTVSGSQVTRNNEPNIIATTVKRGNGILQLRNDDGIPAWIGWKVKCQHGLDGKQID